MGQENLVQLVFSIWFVTAVFVVAVLFANTCMEALREYQEERGKRFPQKSLSCYTTRGQEEPEP